MRSGSSPRRRGGLSGMEGCCEDTALLVDLLARVGSVGVEDFYGPSGSASHLQEVWAGANTMRASQGWTKEEIHEQFLNALLCAKAVMRWTENSESRFSEDGDYRCSDDIVWRSGAPWNPLTSDSDAFMLVRAMLAKGYQFRLYAPFSFPDLPTAAEWWAVITAPAPSSEPFLGSDPALPKAIARACLKAVGVDSGGAL